MKSFNVALDGPSGAGKSSVAKEIARKYHLHHLDTGAMYRAIALALHQEGIAPQEGQALTKALEQITLDVEGDQVFINKDNVTSQIRQPEISKLASQYSALPSVRKKLVAIQQQIASRKGFILDGRDICDVVLPGAEVKIYLDASPKARAMRRMLQDEEKGIHLPFEQVLAAIEARDLADRTRESDPLRISENAVVVDSSNMDFDQTVKRIEEILNQALKEAGND